MALMQRAFKSWRRPWWRWRAMADRRDRRETYFIYNMFDGRPGGWWDFSDLSTMWQDTAGEIPVTADSDPVGRVDDKSGNGNNLLQATAANRPLYKTDGPRGWLAADGTNDSLRATFAIPQPWERVSAIHQVTWTVNDYIFGGATANAGNLYQSSVTPFIRISSGVAGVPQSLTLATDGLVTERHNGLTSALALNFASLSVHSAGTTAPGGVTIFANQGLTVFSNIRCYGFAMRAGPWDAVNLRKVREYFATRAGITF